MELKIRIEELWHQADTLGRQAKEVYKVNRKQGLDLMRQARDASKKCQALIEELNSQVES